MEETTIKQQLEKLLHHSMMIYPNSNNHIDIINQLQRKCIHRGVRKRRRTYIQHN